MSAAMKPGDEWAKNEFLEGAARACRIHFPLDRCRHDGGTAQLRKWAMVLRGLADTLDALSQGQKIEQMALAFAATAIHRANVKIGGFRTGRRSLDG